MEYETEGIQGVQKKGFCSTFLAEAEIGLDVCLCIKQSGFHLPEKKDSSAPEDLSKMTSFTGREPILLIGAGSGLAPFRGFWQQILINITDPKYHKNIVQKIEGLNYDDEDVSEVDALKKLVNSCIQKSTQGVDRKCQNVLSKRSIKLFFGCRNRESNLLSKETELYSGFLTRFDAFSREKDVPKEYNHDVMKKQAELVYTTLVKQGGVVFVCGKMAMADSVFQRFIGTVAQRLIKDSNMENDEEKIAFTEKTAQYLLNSLKDNGRYYEDLFDDISSNTGTI